MPRYTLDTEKVSDLIDRAYPSLRKAAKDMGISHSYLSKVLTGKREPGKKFIDGILAAFKEIKFEEIFKKQND
ncbi:MAG: helix-turn-helix transcriptional regulator [Peptococcaceae bacterium]|nr:helix-turn-helix transcriptional regulator [Peptococcaceae bacterium]